MSPVCYLEQSLDHGLKKKKNYSQYYYGAGIAGPNGLSKIHITNY